MNYQETANTPFLPVWNYGDGTGRWGHHALGGGMNEWVRDEFALSWYSQGGASCDNCANLTDINTPVLRGGSWRTTEATVRGVYRNGASATLRERDYGFRCARSL